RDGGVRRGHPAPPVPGPREGDVGGDGRRVQVVVQHPAGGLATRLRRFGLLRGGVRVLVQQVVEPVAARRRLVQQVRVEQLLQDGFGVVDRDGGRRGGQVGV